MWQAPERGRPRIPARSVTLVDAAIFAGGVILAALVGIGASGVPPL
jgi:hypothetical protein